MPSSGQTKRTRDTVAVSARRRSPREPYRGSTGYLPPPPATGPGFTERAATEFAEVTKGQLGYWDTAGLVRRSREIDGKLFYSYRDLIELHLVRRLLKNSAEQRSIRIALNDLRQRYGQGLGFPTAELIVSGTEVISLSSQSLASDADTIRLGEVEEHVKRKLDKAKVDLTRPVIVDRGVE